eukprot:a339228_1064.p1 GENE.a339228_1064~~a339228_1064.p1  ORF type:complete len:334 (-),score=158.61 a339228_1064:61-1032(-)
MADIEGDAESWAPLLALLHGTKLGDMARRKPSIIVIPSSSNLSDAFSTLINNRVTSAPVLDERTSKYTGFLDIRDLVSFIVHYGRHVTEGNFVVADVCAAGSGSVLDNVTVTYLSRRNPFKSAKHDACVLDAIRILGGSVKRLAVVDGDGKVVNIISQSDLIQFLAKNAAAMPEAFRHAPINELFHVEMKPVVCVDAAESVLAALTKMDDSKITGVGITHGGQLIGNISGKDLKAFIRSPTYEQLHMPVMEMLKELRQREMVDISIPIITVFPNSPFETTLKKIAATKVHRVYVVESEEHFRPVGIVSQTAVLKRMAAIDALH